MLWHDQKNQRKVETEKDRKTRPPTDRAFGCFENNWRKVSKVALILDEFDLKDIACFGSVPGALPHYFRARSIEKLDEHSQAASETSYSRWLGIWIGLPADSGG
jgi:hypothetical protein